jgi:hypothetical protein
LNSTQVGGSGNAWFARIADAALLSEVAGQNQSARLEESADLQIIEKIAIFCK